MNPSIVISSSASMSIIFARTSFSKGFRLLGIGGDDLADRHVRFE